MNVPEYSCAAPSARRDIFNPVTLRAFRIDQGCMWVGGSHFYFCLAVSVCVSVCVSCVCVWWWRKRLSYQQSTGFPSLPVKTSRGASAQSSREEGQEVGLRSQEVDSMVRRSEVENRPNRGFWRQQKPKVCK